MAQERKNSPLLLIDRNGQTVSVLDYPSIGQIVKAHNFSDGRALIMTSENKYGYIDTQGKLIIPPIYSEASDFNEGKALVGRQNESGSTGIQVIDTKGKSYSPYSTIITYMPTATVMNYCYRIRKTQNNGAI